MSIHIDAAVPTWGDGDHVMPGQGEPRRQSASSGSKRAGLPAQAAGVHDRLTGPPLPQQREGASPEDSAAAPGAAVLSAPGDRSAQVAPFPAWLRRWGLHVEMVLAVAVGLAFVVPSPMPVVALATFGFWIVGAFYRGRAVTTPLVHQLRVVASSALLPLALLSVGVAALGLPAAAVKHSVLAVSAGVVVTALSRSLRWPLQAPVRVLAVGDRAAVATAIAQLPRTSNCRVVGVIVAEEGLSSDSVPQQILGVPCFSDLEAIADVVSANAADLVVVDPGRGVSADDFRHLTWQLEGLGVALGVSGVIRSVAPHRLNAGKLGRSSVLDVRLPRQSRWVRATKAALDRVLGAVVLVAVAPVMLVLALAIRLDTPGAALFRQTRVGKGGRLFTVWKFRTMVLDAEGRKPELAELDGAHGTDGLLFKLRDDPRVTRLGAFLRTSSLDELPQLINVVRGEMSLVGPRPHVPVEVKKMDDATLRRHTVAPGMTGLWQVSGRSDLPRDEACDLDTFYADNWTLSGDMVILARTVKAVIGRKGAY
jgi:exopolysaccharide biosynthesis polyprenyl glycosylphosphotransferase